MQFKGELDDIKIKTGDVTIELFEDVAPKTCRKNKKAC